MKPKKIRDLVQRQAFIWADIEDGICSVQCAAARHPGVGCVCACRGQNHGGLWREDVARALQEDDETQAA